MAQVRFTLEQPSRLHEFRFLQPNGILESISALRLSVIVDLSQSVMPGVASSWAAYPDCIFDTGSHLTTIPERLHRHLKPGVVTPLPFDPSMPANLRFMILAGGSYPYELGRITIRL